MSAVTRFHYLCVVEHPPLHTVRSGVLPVDQVTRYEGQWAYCLKGGKFGHLWSAIGPLDLTEIRIMVLALQAADRATAAD